MRVIDSTRLVAAVLTMLAGAAEAKLYKWVDEHGQVQYSDKAPPSGSKRSAELSRSGVVLHQSDDLLTPEQRRLRDAALAAEQEDSSKKLEQQRKDRALLNTFADAREIDIIRDRNIEQVQAVILSLQSRKNASERRLAEYQKTANQMLKAGKTKMAQEILDDMADTRNDLQAIDKEMAAREQDVAQIRNKAEADKKRLLELRSERNKVFENRGIKPPPQ